MINLCRIEKCKKLVVTFFLVMVAAIFAPGLALTANATTETTTETYTGDTNINDFSVTMDSNGNISTSFDDDTANTNTIWNWIYGKGKIILTGITGICALICTGILIVAAVKFAGSGGNPQGRHSAMVGILVGAIGTALLGGASLIMALSWNFLS